MNQRKYHHHCHLEDSEGRFAATISHLDETDEIEIAMGPMGRKDADKICLFKTDSNELTSVASFFAAVVGRTRHSEYKKTFMGCAIEGLYPNLNLAFDNAVDEWHAGRGNGELYEYLGMSEREYARYIEGKITLEDLVVVHKAKKLGI